MNGFSFSNPHNYPLPSNLENLLKKIHVFLISKFSLPEDLIDVSVLDVEEIKELNLKYRNKSKETDVLSFPIGEPSFLGAIYFCYPVILEQNPDLIREFSYLFIHSFLHLLGYEHGDEMFCLQDEIFASFF